MVYTLIGADGQPHASAEKGTAGGHRGTKIFGRLDCPAALRAIARGQYVSHRVFFADPATATQAGYRPCAVCMPGAYQTWKATRQTHHPPPGRRTATVTRSGDHRTETVYQSEQLDVRTTDAVVGGQPQHLEWVARPGVVLAIPYVPDGRLILVRQYRSATDSYTLELPAGKIDADEDPHQALERELREEAGYRLDTVRYLGVLLTAPHFSDETIHVYLTSGEIVSQPQPTPREQLTVELAPPAEIDGLIGSGELTDAKSLAALLLHERTRGPR